LYGKVDRQYYGALTVSDPPIEEPEPEPGIYKIYQERKAKHGKT
jgi:hypothetical protein